MFVVIQIMDGSSSIIPLNKEEKSGFNELIFNLSLQFFISLHVTIILLLQPVQEPAKMTQIIVEALEKTGQRGIINKGWGGLGNCKDVA